MKTREEILGALLPLYAEMIAVDGVIDRLKDGWTCVPHFIGGQYDLDDPGMKKILYIGRAVNGWSETDFSGAVSPEDYAKRALGCRWSIEQVIENPKVRCADTQDESGSGKTYNFKRSPFWQLCGAIYEELGERKANADDPSKGDSRWGRMVWSNLYKIAPYETGNPDAELSKMTRPACVKIIREEVRLFAPDLVVFVTGYDFLDDKANGFASEFGRERISEPGNFLVESRGTIDGVPYSVVIRPEKRVTGNTRRAAARAIIKGWKGMPI